MSSRPAPAARVFGVLVLVAAPLAAQDSAATLARMERRLDSLRAVVAVADSVARSELRTDTVVVGSLRVATTPELRPVVEVAAGLAWERLGTEFGGGLAGIVLPTLPLGSTADSASGGATVELLALAIQRPAAREIWARQDSALVNWLGGYLPANPAVGGGGILAEMIGTPAIPNTDCLDGDTAACALALGLGPTPPTLADWYAPATWPGLVQRARTSLDARAGRERLACVEGRDPAACQVVLSRAPAAIPVPVAFRGRALLAGLALQSGGTGAFERLTEDPTSELGVRLAHASGRSLDSLLTAWLAAIRSTPPRGSPPGGVEFVLVLAWAGPVLLLSLRGSRCR